MAGFGSLVLETTSHKNSYFLGIFLLPFHNKTSVINGQAKARHQELKIILGASVQKLNEAFHMELMDHMHSIPHVLQIARVVCRVLEMWLSSSGIINFGLVIT